MPWMKLPGGGVAHLCIRGKAGRKATCASCGTYLGELECDGCDRRLCTTCEVSPRDGLNFCPSCSREAFLHYLNNHGGRAVYEKAGRPKGRESFREWARREPEKFLELAAKRTPASLAEVAPTPHELWKQSGGDQAK